MGNRTEDGQRVSVWRFGWTGREISSVGGHMLAGQKFPIPIGVIHSSWRQGKKGFNHGCGMATN